MTDFDWCSWEQEEFDKARVRAFALACVEESKRALAQFNRAVDQIEIARKNAARAQARFEKMSDIAERMVKVAGQLVDGVMRECCADAEEGLGEATPAEQDRGPEEVHREHHHDPPV